MTTDPAGVREILIATGNPGKYREIAQVLGNCGLGNADCGLTKPPAEAGTKSGVLAVIRWRSLKDLPAPIPEPVEDGHTFAENAALKARYYARATGLWTLADDSGLEVDALSGAPGVHSARYAGSPTGTPRVEVDRTNNRRLIDELRHVPAEKRTARFRCALALSDGERILATAEGAVEGRMVDTARGDNGFGYDPHFFLEHLGRTMAELPAEEKNRLSHRGQALVRMQLELLRLFLPLLSTTDP